MSFRVLTAELQHETNTFSVRPTTHDDFVAGCALQGEDAIRERGRANTELAGFLDVAGASGWSVHHAISALAVPAGPVTRDAFDRLSEPILRGVAQARGGLDGVLLGLHGAMVLDFAEDGEGELLQRLRSLLGPDVPIAVTLDLHANVSQRMCALAQILVSYKTYPHVDMRETGRHAARILQRTMAGEIRPRTLRVHRPMLGEANAGRTDTGPMVAWVSAARAHEARPHALAASINAGFGDADIAEVGPTVLVTYDGDPQPHRAFAEGIADAIWENRANLLSEFLSPAEAVAAALAGSAGRGPVIIADFADNPGGGAYGDATALLAAMLDAGVSDACFGPMIDPQAAALLQGVEVGADVSVRLGGKVDPAHGGPPLDLAGTLLHRSDGSYVGDGPMVGGLHLSSGPTAVLRVAGIDILVTSRGGQMLDQQQFRAFGIDPAARRIVALKSMQHFRAAFEPIASRVLLCDGGALCTPDRRKRRYRNVPRPIYPLDPGMTLSAVAAAQ